MALTILTAGLAACGLLLLLWSVAEAMLLPLPREDAVLVAPLQGEQLCAAGQAAEYLERLGAFEA